MRHEERMPQRERQAHYKPLQSFVIQGDDISIPNVPPKREMLNIRIKTEERNLIDCAARICGKNRTDFVLEAARLAAEEALLNRAVFLASLKAALR
ncbi:MAG: DUF1778 domain-containing protein [Oxalobacter formigenes]|nr:DUF1778 domain-containing protein [Oxalobacter formigenes]